MPTKTKATTMFNGVVLEEIMAVDPGIVWCWQKAYDDRVIRVSVIEGGHIGIAEDDVSGHHSKYRAIYLDDDCIAAINHARSLTNG